MFWRYREDRSDDGVPVPAGRIIEDHYRACDAVVGEALRDANGETLVIVLSDHGMKSFRRGVHLNTWLHDQGLLALRGGIEPGDEAGDLLRAVDWERTRAYALGLSGIYLNVRGREGKGIVRPDEVDGLATRIVDALTGLPDPKLDRRAVRRVLTRAQLYRGPFADESPDLVVDFADGYRVSWGTALGGVPAGQFEDNLKKWSGDHLMDPSLVPGVLFMNRAFHGVTPSLLDMAPTILSALGVPSGSPLEGESLLT
jgi:predicted AlkP superfamily phosphohydrolase/phosphomutase